MCHIFTTNRCKENNPALKLSPEELDSIAEIKESIKDQTNAFFEMEAFLPKKNGYKAVIRVLIAILYDYGLIPPPV